MSTNSAITRVTAIFYRSFRPDKNSTFRTGNLIANGAMDGQIQVWDTRRTVAPKIKLLNAHQADSQITNVTFSYDNNALASRGEDGFLKVWDIRNTKKTLAVRNAFCTLW